MSDRTKITITVSKNSFFISTYSRKYRSPDNFCILKENVRNLEQKRSITVCNIPSFARLWLENRNGKEIVFIEFSWLNDTGGTLSGSIQLVALPFKCFQNLEEEFNGKNDIQRTILSSEYIQLPKIKMDSCRNIQQVIKNPKIKYKFSKFLGSNFRWPDYERIVIYDDFIPYSFGFSGYRHDGRRGICGGIILHLQDNMEKAYYAVHT